MITRQERMTLTQHGTVRRMRTATIATTAALLLSGVFAAPASAAPRTGLTAVQVSSVRPGAWYRVHTCVRHLPGIPFPIRTCAVRLPFRPIPR